MATNLKFLKKEMDRSMAVAIETLQKAQKDLREGWPPNRMGVLQRQGDNIERLAAEINLLVALEEKKP